MKLKNIITKATYSCIGHLSNESDLEKFGSYLLFNWPVLKYFKELIYVVNYNEESKQYLSQLEYILKEHNIKLIDAGLSLGHSVGAALNDNLAIKHSNNKWVCKSTVDVIFKKSILNIEVSDNIDFYYLNGIGFGGMEKYDFNYDTIIEKDFYPQTNFYFINKSKIDFLNDEKYILETNDYLNKIPDYNGRPWEFIPNWSCEDFLKNCVLRNNLTKEHLICQDSYRKLLKLIENFNIHDPSHKNMMIDGICHFHNNENPIVWI